MKIGINALYLLPGKVGGSEVYLRNLVTWLSKIDNQNEYFIYINKESEGIFEELVQDMKIVQCPIKASSRLVRILWEQLILPFQVKLHNIDILLSAGMTSPFICPATSALVIYDLQHVNQPWNFSKFYLLFLKSIIYLSTKSSDTIITISNKVKEDIIKHYKIPQDKVSVIYLGTDKEIFFVRDADEVRSLREKYHLPDRFILFIASSLPHKNYVMLLKAFKIVQKEMDGIKLVLMGARDYGYQEILEKIKELKLQDDVIFMGWIPYEDVPLVYCASLVFVFPSLHEGFGIPIVEAMACGIPVVCSKIEPLIEVAGDAAFFVDPYSPVDIAKGVLSVLTDNQLRERHIKKGFKRARRFTWKDTALGTLSTLESYAKNQRR